MTKYAKQEAIQALGEMVSLLNVLQADLEEAANALDINDTPVNRRAAVRVTFSMIEGMTYGLKQWAAQYPDSFSTGELLLLKEESYELKDTGKVKQTSARLQTLPNLRFSIEAVARVFNVANPLDASQPGWQHLRDSIQVRHRLMHPKSAQSMEVTEHEINSLAYAANYYLDTISVLMKAIQHETGTNVSVSPASSA